MTQDKQPEALRRAHELQRGNHEFSIDASHCLKTQAQEINRLEKSESDLIDERDRRDEIIDRMADAVLGTYRHEWSSHYDLEDAAQEIEVKMLEQRAELERLRAEVEGLRKDAGRYQKLRSNWFTMSASYHDDKVQLYTGGTRYCSATLEELDAAVDALQSTKVQP